MFLEGFAILVLTVPIVFPIMLTMGLDPIWFGIYLVTMVEVGLITPPVGMVLFVALMFAFPGLIGWLPSKVG